MFEVPSKNADERRRNRGGVKRDHWTQKTNQPTHLVFQVAIWSLTHAECDDIESCQCDNSFVVFALVNHDEFEETDIFSVCLANVKQLEDTGEKCAVETTRNLEIFLGDQMCFVARIQTTQKLVVLRTR